MKKSEELQNLINNNNVYFYDKIREDKRIVQFTESYEVAEQLDWADNYVAISETEEGYDGVYLKGYAPKKTESMILVEQYQSEIVELKKYLSDTDYKAIKFAEGEITESDYQDVKTQRHDARVRINELESMIEELEKGNNSK